MSGQAEFARALNDPASPVPNGVISARGDVDALRFVVYRNNVHVSLVNALKAAFPVVGKLVGDDFFTAMARHFVATNKPRTPLLSLYGEAFPDFVEAFEPARSVRYLADVARLECAWSQAYSAADAEAMDINALSGLDPERLLSGRLVVHPASRLIRSEFPVGSIWQAHQGKTVGAITQRGAETILVTRPDADVRVTVVADQGDAAFTASLIAGDSVVEAAHSGLALNGAFDLGTALLGAVSTGAFTDIESDEGAQP